MKPGELDGLSHLKDLLQLRSSGTFTPTDRVVVGLGDDYITGSYYGDGKDYYAKHGRRVAMHMKRFAKQRADVEGSYFEGDPVGWIHAADLVECGPKELAISGMPSVEALSWGDIGMVALNKEDPNRKDDLEDRDMYVEKLFEMIFACYSRAFSDHTVNVHMFVIVMNGLLNEPILLSRKDKFYPRIVQLLGIGARTYRSAAVFKQFVELAGDEEAAAFVKENIAALVGDGLEDRFGDELFDDAYDVFDKLFRFNGKLGITRLEVIKHHYDNNNTAPFDYAVLWCLILNGDHVGAEKILGEYHGTALLRSDEKWQTVEDGMKSVRNNLMPSFRAWRGFSLRDFNPTPPKAAVLTGSEANLTAKRRDFDEALAASDYHVALMEIEKFYVDPQVLFEDVVTLMWQYGEKFLDENGDAGAGEALFKHRNKINVPIELGIMVSAKVLELHYMSGAKKELLDFVETEMSFDVEGGRTVHYRRFMRSGAYYFAKTCAELGEEQVGERLYGQALQVFNWYLPVLNGTKWGEELIEVFALPHWNSKGFSVWENCPLDFVTATLEKLVAGDSDIAGLLLIEIYLNHSRGKREGLEKARAICLEFNRRGKWAINRSNSLKLIDRFLSLGKIAEAEELIESSGAVAQDNELQERHMTVLLNPDLLDDERFEKALGMMSGSPQMGEKFAARIVRAVKKLCVEMVSGATDKAAAFIQAGELAQRAGVAQEMAEDLQALREQYQIIFYDEYDFGEYLDGVCGSRTIEEFFNDELRWDFACKLFERDRDSLLESIDLAACDGRLKNWGANDYLNQIFGLEKMECKVEDEKLQIRLYLQSDKENELDPVRINAVIEKDQLQLFMDGEGRGKRGKYALKMLEMLLLEELADLSGIISEQAMDKRNEDLSRYRTQDVIKKQEGDLAGVAPESAELTGMDFLIFRNKLVAAEMASRLKFPLELGKLDELFALKDSYWRMVKEQRDMGSPVTFLEIGVKDSDNPVLEKFRMYNRAEARRRLTAIGVSPMYFAEIGLNSEESNNFLGCYELRCKVDGSEEPVAFTVFLDANGKAVIPGIEESNPMYAYCWMTVMKNLAEVTVPEIAPLAELFQRGIGRNPLSKRSREALASPGDSEYGDILFARRRYAFAKLLARMGIKDKAAIDFQRRLEQIRSLELVSSLIDLIGKKMSAWPLYCRQQVAGFQDKHLMPAEGLFVDGEDGENHLNMELFEKLFGKIEGFEGVQMIELEHKLVSACDIGNLPQKMLETLLDNVSVKRGPGGMQVTLDILSLEKEPVDGIEFVKVEFGGRILYLRPKKPRPISVKLGMEDEGVVIDFQKKTKVLFGIIYDLTQGKLVNGQTLGLAGDDGARELKRRSDGGEPVLRYLLSDAVKDLLAMSELAEAIVEIDLNTGYRQGVFRKLRKFCTEEDKIYSAEVHRAVLEEILAEAAKIVNPSGDVYQKGRRAMDALAEQMGRMEDLERRLKGREPGFNFGEIESQVTRINVEKDNEAGAPMYAALHGRELKFLPKKGVFEALYLATLRAFQIRNELDPRMVTVRNEGKMMCYEDDDGKLQAVIVVPMLLEGHVGAGEMVMREFGDYSEFEFEDIEGELFYLDPQEMEDYEGVAVKFLPNSGKYASLYAKNLEKFGKPEVRGKHKKYVLPEGQVLVAAEMEGELRVIMVKRQFLQWQQSSEDDQLVRDGIFEEFVDGLADGFGDD